MRLFGDAKVLRGSVTWTNPLRLRVTVLPQPVPAQEAPSAVQPVEYDEDGREWVFRYSRTAPQRYAVDRDRIFQYLKRHRLPSEGARQIRRDLRNTVDFYTGVRDIQTHSDVEQL
jgi:hypothetical protein